MSAPSRFRSVGRAGRPKNPVPALVAGSPGGPDATPSLTVFGAPSTRSLASFRPSPVKARTSLITSIFLSPTAARTTVNSVFSSTAAAAAPGAAATATAAAADTPHFSSRSFESSAASSTVSFESSSTIFVRSAILLSSRFEPLIDCGTASGGFTLSAVGPDHARELGSRRGDDLRDLGRRRLQQADDLRAQLIERREGG